MGISEAIARVRKSAKKASLEGALASVGASLGAGLQSAAIPPRLRPAASRIASLLGAPSGRREPASLDQGGPPRAHQAHAAALAGDVCPFTGLRADGTLADLSANLAGASDTARENDAASERGAGSASADLGAFVDAPTSDEKPRLSAAARLGLQTEAQPVPTLVEARGSGREPDHDRGGGSDPGVGEKLAG
jgi:hypothetical protein